MPSYLCGDDNFDSLNKGILQTQSQVFTDWYVQTVSTIDMVIGAITTTLVTKQANSKFVIYARWFGECVGAWDMVWNVRIDGVRINSANATANTMFAGTSATRQSYVDDDNSSTPESMELMVSCLPGKPAGATITVDLTAIGSSGTRGINTNRCFGSPANNYETGSSELIIQEIAV